jgi:uncharacterized membrane protein YdjX (TVP38/TMEM64 family)
VLFAWGRSEAVQRGLETARAFIEGLGWEGVPVYAAVFVAGSIMLVPATALSAVAPILFGPWLGFVAILIGNMAAAAAMFALVRRTGARWTWLGTLRRSLPEGLIRLAHGNGLLLIFYARLIMLPASPVTYAASLLPVSFAELFVGTFLGVLPHSLSTALSIGLLRDAWLEGRWSTLLRWEAGLLAVTYAATFWAVYRIRRWVSRAGKPLPV